MSLLAKPLAVQARPTAAQQMPLVAPRPTLLARVPPVGLGLRGRAEVGPIDMRSQPRGEPLSPHSFVRAGSRAMRNRRTCFADAICVLQVLAPGRPALLPRLKQVVVKSSAEGAAASPAPVPEEEKKFMGLPMLTWQKAIPLGNLGVEQAAAGARALCSSCWLRATFSL